MSENDDLYLCEYCENMCAEWEMDIVSDHEPNKCVDCQELHNMIREINRLEKKRDQETEDHWKSLE